MFLQDQKKAEEIFDLFPRKVQHLPGQLYRCCEPQRLYLPVAPFFQVPSQLVAQVRGEKPSTPLRKVAFLKDIFQTSLHKETTVLRSLGH